MIMSLRPFVRPLAGLSALLVMTASVAGAQARYNAPNVRVEVLGLERWTLRMLQDSVAHYVPGQKLHDAACMATLRYSLKFRDALVMTYSGFGTPDSKQEFLSIRVAEPGRGPKWRSVATDDFMSLLPDYASLLLPVTDSAGSIWNSRLHLGLYFRDAERRTRMLSRGDSATRASMQADGDRVLAFLETHRSEADRLRAVRALDSNSVFANRVAAAYVLSSFPEHDDAWHALVRALRDPHETVRGAAELALSTMPRRAVNWAPVSNELRLLLGGANLSGMDGVMSMLVETKVSPALARGLLRQNGVWINRLLNSEAPGASSRTRTLLVALNGGTDLGTSPAAWRTWLASQ